MIQYDYHLMRATAIGETGISDEKLAKGFEQFAPLHREVQGEKQREELGFATLPHADTGEIVQLAEAVRTECESLILIGIGGSDLGTRAVHRALNHQFYNSLPAERRGGPKLYFLGDTTDPRVIQEVLDVVDLAHTTLVMVSKSGNTIEQMSTFLTLRERLIEVVGEEASKQRVIIITDGESGTLREMVRQDGYRSLVVPASVGGRFSVLASVGLFPLAVVGIDVRALLTGARIANEVDTSRSPEENPAALFALLQYLGYQQGQRTSVFLPYDYSLREVGFWYRQLWAESLGKAVDRAGNRVHVGPTPVASIGPTDQHSQLQLYVEGPADKLFTFVTVAKPAADLTVPAAYPTLDGAAYLAGTSFATILQAEAQSTALSLAEAGRPSATFKLAELNAESLGALLYTFELAVSYAGKLFNVNAFDQPGVERSKQLMYGLLGRSGYTSTAIEEHTDSLVQF